MPGSGSLRRSILVWLVLATAAIGVLALLDTRNEARRTARDVSDRVLIGSAMSISEAVTVTAEGGIAISIPFSALDMLSSTAQDQVFYRVDGPGGILTGYDDLPPSTAATQSMAGLADQTYRGMRVRTATILRDLTTGEGTVPFSVTVAETTLARDALEQSILTRSALRIAMLIFGAAVVAWAAATYALRPLDRLSGSLASRAPNDMTPIAATAPDELRPVLAALNGYLSRLSTAMTTVQNFASNANHQIRTPLTVARTQIAMAAKSGADVQPQPLERADQALIRIERVLEQLLLLARLQATGTGPHLTEVDVAALASSITADLLPKALSMGQDLGYDGPAWLTALSEEVLLGELLRNLVENAIAHCPADALITVHVEAAGPDRVLLSVVDTGPPLPDALITVLRSRIKAGGTGSDVRTGTRGLGLHIVTEIAHALKVDLRLERGENGAGLAWSIGIPTRLAQA